MISLGLFIVLAGSGALYLTAFHQEDELASKPPTTRQEDTETGDKTDVATDQPATQNPSTTDQNTTKDGTKTGQGTKTNNGSGSNNHSTGGNTGGGTPDNGGSGGDTGGASCALPKYPDATCTGVPAGTTLTAYTGPTNINSSTTIGERTIDGKLITSCLTVSVAGVVIKNSKITANCQYLVDAIGFTGTWLTIQDSELDCGQHGGTTAIGEERVTVLRSNIHGCENGFDVNGYMNITDNYIHDLYQTGGCSEPGPHTDGIQTWPDGTDITIQHNTIYAYSDSQEHCATSAIINGSSGMTNVIIKENLLAGGAYTLYCGNSNTFQVINNHFSRRFVPNVGEYGPWADCENDTVSGNVYHETGLPVPL